MKSTEIITFSTTSPVKNDNPDHRKLVILDQTQRGTSTKQILHSAQSRPLNLQTSLLSDTTGHFERSLGGLA